MSSKEDFSRFEKMLIERGGVFIMMKKDRVFFMGYSTDKSLTPIEKFYLSDVKKKNYKVYNIDRSDLPIGLTNDELEKHCITSLFPDLREKHKEFRSG